MVKLLSNGWFWSFQTTYAKLSSLLLIFHIYFFMKGKLWKYFASNSDVVSFNIFIIQYFLLSSLHTYKTSCKIAKIFFFVLSPLRPHCKLYIPNSHTIVRLLNKLYIQSSFFNQYIYFFCKKKNQTLNLFFMSFVSSHETLKCTSKIQN